MSSSGLFKYLFNSIFLRFKFISAASLQVFLLCAKEGNLQYCEHLTFRSKATRPETASYIKEKGRFTVLDASVEALSAVGC